MEDLEHKIEKSFLEEIRSFFGRNWVGKGIASLSLIGLLGLGYGCIPRQVKVPSIKERIEQKPVYKPSPYLKNLTQLTFNKSDDDIPQISRDGRYLAFISNRSGENQIWLRKLGTRTTIQKTTGPGENTYPCFSPDGKKIAFTNWASGNGDIFVMPTEKGLLKTIIARDSNPEGFCSWSPDGTKIAYTVAPSHSEKWTSYIWIYDFGNSSYSQVIDGRDPEWSPDGSKLVFYRVEQFKKWTKTTKSGRKHTYTNNFQSLWMVNADGTGLTQLTSNDYTPEQIKKLKDSNFENYNDVDNWYIGDVSPTWSSDGKRIAFVSSRSGNYDVWIINSNGTGLTQITTHPAIERFPAFGPDGKIYFSSKRKGNLDIWSAVLQLDTY